MNPGPQSEQERWQAEADLLADGRELLERLCASTRYRYLYPDGPNVALLLEAYQELERLRTVGRVRGGPWRQRRALRKILHRAVRRDVLDRNRRLNYHYPRPRLHQLPPPPELVRRAVQSVDHDARDFVEAHIGTRPSATGVAGAKVTGGAARGLAQFRDALLGEALARPSNIGSLHPQYLFLLSTPPPARRRHPIANLIFVRLPLQLLLLIVTLFNVGYIGAYYLFNDARLGRFVSNNVNKLIDGDLEMGSIHWEGRLIVDLITGTPTHCIVDDVTVWEPYKTTDHDRERRAIHADRVELTLTLHEIIPWNRLGVPTVFDIPWVLNFPEVAIDDPMWVTVRQYDDARADGTPVKFMGMRDAFRPIRPPTGKKGLSFAVGDARLGPLLIDIDYSETARWRTSAQLDSAAFSLRFDAPDPIYGRPIDLPFRFEVAGSGQRGVLQINDVEVPMGAIDVQRLESGRGVTGLGDVGFAAKADAAGSPVHFSGVLEDVFSRTPVDGGEPVPFTADVSYGGDVRVQLDVASPAARDLTEHISVELGLPRQAIVAREAATASIEGSIGSPTYRIAAQGVALDFMREPAWASFDVQTSMTIASQEPPQRWSDRLEPDARRQVVTFDTLRGSALNGDFDIKPDAQLPHIVLPSGSEPYLIAADLELNGIDPGQLFPDTPQVAATFRGTATGGVDVHRLVVGPKAQSPGAPEAPMGLHAIELRFDDAAIERERGPKQDNIPRSVRLDGTVAIDDTGALDVDDLVLATDGTRLEVDGGVDGDLAKLRATLLDLRIDDGSAFARAFDVPTVRGKNVFSTLAARMKMFGPILGPSGSDGKLAVSGVGGPATTSASMWLERGVLHLRAPEAHLFGGTGPVEIEVGLLERGALSRDPKVRATLALKDVDLAQAVGPPFSGRVDLEADIGDGEGNAARLSNIRGHGLATADRFLLGGTIYRDASLSFRLTPEEFAIDQVVLPIHRSVSPGSDDSVTVPVGVITGDGTVSLDRDPELDLLIEADGVPLSVVARLLDVEAPVRGQIAKGTKLTVGGTLGRPKVEGKVELRGLSGAGVALGGGALDVTSEDFAADAPLAAHRELRVSGELASHSSDKDHRVGWTIDAVVAIAQKQRGEEDAPVAAQLDVSVDRLALANLLRDPVDPERSPPVDGAFEGLEAHVLTCNPGRPMLTDCTTQKHEQRSLSVELQVDKTWLSGRTSTKRAPGDRCSDPATLCSQQPLVATVDWPIVELEEPWTLATGGDPRSEITLQGKLDLSSPPRAAVAAATGCRPPPLSDDAARVGAAGAPGGQGDASFAGTIDLGAAAPLLRPYGLEAARGKLVVDFEVAGHLSDPRVRGTAKLRPGGKGLVIDVDPVPFPVQFTDLRLRIRSGWASAEGAMRVLGETVEFGSVLGEHTGYALAGPCKGQFGVAAKGVIGSRLITNVVGNSVAGASGAVDLRRLHVQGNTTGELELTKVEGSVGFTDHSLKLEFNEGINQLTVDRGRLDFHLCGEHDCGSDAGKGWLALYAGGVGAADSSNVPATALRAKVGARGEAALWGRTYLASDFSRLSDARVDLRLDDVPYRDFDSRGRPVYEGELTSKDLRFRGGTPLIMSGHIDVDRARYVKDAVKGVDLLRLADDVDVVESPPAEIIRSVQFDLLAKTVRPLRVENNVASGVEADVIVAVAGTYDDPEFTGRFDVDPGGEVDIPFLTGTYEILRGRVTLVRTVADAEVDILALRQEPIYIEDQPREVQLLLTGTLSEIRPSCIVEGDVGGALDTLRGCTDYLVLGAGDVQGTETDVRRYGAGGLSGARKSLQVVGHLTEVDIGRGAAKAAPRFRNYIPDMRLRLGQIGPELEISTPRRWLDFDYGRARLGWDYTRGYPGYLLRQSRELTFRLEFLDPITIEFSRRTRSYLNERIIFDPLEQRTLELRFDFEIPSLR